MTVRQFNAFSNQSRLNSLNQTKVDKQEQKLAQQQERHEIRTARANAIWNGIRFVLLFLLNGVLLLIGLGCTGLLAFYIVRLFRKSTADYFIWREQADHELRLEREMTKRIKYQFAPNKGVFDGLRLSGNLTFNPNNSVSDNHSSSLSNHHKTPRLNSSRNQEIIDVKPIEKITQNFKDLLQLEPPKNHLAVGYDMKTQEPVFMPYSSSAYGAISGGGKSSNIAAWAAQLPDSSIALCDSHRDSEQSLTHRLEPIKHVLAIDSAESVDECKQAMGWVLDEFHRRRKSGDKFDDFKPLFFIADEWLAMQRDSDLAEQAENLAHVLIQEARKVNMHCILSGQTYKASQATGAHHIIGNKIIGKMDIKQARMLSGMTNDMLPKDTLFLNAGESYLMSWNDPTPRKIYTPYSDFSLVPDDYKMVTNQQQLGFLNTHGNQDVTISKEVRNCDLDTNLSTEELRILNLYIKHGDSGQIVNEVYKSNSGGKLTGRPRMDKLNFVNQVIRQNLSKLVELDRKG